MRFPTSNHTSAVVALKHAYVQRALKHCAHCGGKLSKEALKAQKINDAARRERQLAEAQWRRAIARRREFEEQQMQEQRERVQRFRELQVQEALARRQEMEAFLNVEQPKPKPKRKSKTAPKRRDSKQS